MFYAERCSRFPDRFPIETVCADNDWDGWKKLTKKLGSSDSTGRPTIFSSSRREIFS